MVNDTKTAASTTETNEPTFSRDALAASKRYAGKRDVIMVALADGTEYTLADADAAINKYLAQAVREQVNGRDK